MKLRCSLAAMIFCALAAGCAKKDAPVPVTKKATVKKPEPKPVATKKPEPPKTPASKPKPAGAGSVEKLIAQLGSPDFKKREAASAELAKLDEKALPALRKAAKHSDAEVASRAKQAIEAIGARNAEANAPDLSEVGKQMRGMNMRGGRVVIRMGGVGQFGNGMNVRGATSRSVSGAKGTVTITESAGKVALTLAPKGGEAKTYKAPSRAAFKEKYPKLYKTYFGK